MKHSSSRVSHEAGEMIVWGGENLQIPAFYGTGGRYNPANDSWTPTRTDFTSPYARIGHTAVWTGTGMIVWGGYSYTRGRLNDGGIYGHSPAGDGWSPLNYGGYVPPARAGHTAVWTGSEMIVWGGIGEYAAEVFATEYPNTGWRYDSSHAWRRTSVPSFGLIGRVNHTAVWTGTEMLIWGGTQGGGSKNDGWRYNPATDQWALMSFTNAPAGRYGHTAVWTGSEMLVWGGITHIVNQSGNSSYQWLNDCRAYDPTTDQWRVLTADGAPGAPTARNFHQAVWTGFEMIVWGGNGPISSTNIAYLNTGGRLDPVENRWTALTATGAPPARDGHSAVWTGTEMLIWGGRNGVFVDGNSNYLNDLWAYRVGSQLGESYVVNTTDDHDDGTAGVTDCTLREAINRANTRPGAQTITFAPNVTGTITLQLGELVINDNVTIIGPGATVLAVSGNNSSRVFKATAGTVQISGLAIVNGRVTGQAGAPASTPGGFGLDGSTVYGGGIFNQATLILTDCSITGNTVISGAGGLGGSSDGSVAAGMGGTGGFAYGGGVYNEGNLTVVRCTVSGNSIIAGAGGQGGSGLVGSGNGGSGGVGGWAYGGGVYSEGTPTVNHCTLSGNSVVGGAGGAGGTGLPFRQGGAGGAGGNGRGGGMSDYWHLNAASCTFARNTASAGAGGAGGSVGFGGTVGPAGTPGLAQGGGLHSSTSIQIRNSLVAENTGANAPDCSGTFVSGGHNLIGIVDGASGFTSTGDQTGSAASPIDPKIGPLLANGGPTKTIALLSGSPAIDAGVAVPGVTTDQRGVTRPQSLAPDIGAYEYVAGGLGLKAEYYNNTTRSGSPALICRDAPIDFGWDGITGPAPSINATGFSTRWTGFIEIPTAGNYTFYVASDDGVRLWINDVNGAPAVDQWSDRPETENATGTFSFAAGQRVPVKIEFYQNLGGAAMRLRWQGPGIAKAIIPAVSLFPPIDPQAAQPIIIPVPGTYVNEVTISIFTATPGATIRYTTDGSLPSPTAGLVYGGAFTLTSSAEVRAIAVKDDFTPSPVAFASYTIVRPLSFWRQLHGLPSDGSQDLANPSGDGVGNLLKYAFNLAPNAGDLALPNSSVLTETGTAGLPYIKLDAQGRLVIRFVRRKAATNPGVAYIVETGKVLTNMQPLSLSGATVVSIDATWERVTVTDPVVTSKRFGRVRVLAFGTYVNNFNTSLGAATLRRDAVWTNQAVQLTDAINGQMGAVVLDGIEAGPAVSGFTARFNATLGPTSNAPADGLSFSVGDLGTDGWAEAGPPTSHHLSIGFDTFENDVGIPETIGIHLWVSGAHVAYNPINPYTNGGAVPVEVSYDTTTGVTVKFNGATIFSNAAVPGFSFQTGDRFGFGARTGGFNERHMIDDVEITTR